LCPEGGAPHRGMPSASFRALVGVETGSGTALPPHLSRDSGTFSSHGSSVWSLPSELSLQPSLCLFPRKPRGLLLLGRNLDPTWRRYPVCTIFTAEHTTHGHIKMHHTYTNVVVLGDSSTWRLPYLNRCVSMFLAPFLLPIVTPLVAVERLRKVELRTALRTLALISLGLYSHYWLLLNVSGFKSPSSALGCMNPSTRSRLPGVTHVSVTAHWLPMFSRDKPRRIHMMSLRVLNLARVPVLDWVFGHSIISCHVEQHLFPRLSDNMCLKVKPVVSQFLHEKQLPYNEDSYLARFRLFLRCYEEFMVQAPPITELVGLQ
uniref:Fatty acid desaturase 6 n=1 Tax=Theropithecus gelada TaxID=9565 RepID=A0A8D2GGC7_THEGE